ncbi:hypothetical protein [Clavibacter zhangzhiyongii]|uniref:hypothetical protein n=1 Tax=Clavibacter zhangzhiyongii TaxID=2768071 RepID=UPI00195D5F25|nr:hypothetical protein [Clavibacter zhangzhiyongii]MBM7025866.1 hypothetical protein [Clavibacter zhangzhiyongii]
MRRAARPHGLPLALGVVALGSACIAAGAVGVLAMGVIRFQRLLLADPVAPWPDAAHP